MKSLVSLLFVTALLLAAAPIEGAAFAVGINPASITPSNAIRFENISTEQGLSQSTVTAILQDSLGFLWFGTEGGLNKYDGYQFSIYKHDPDDPRSLSSNVITSIYEDQQGKLWIGTIDGLDCLDRKTGTFVHYQQGIATSVLVIHQDQAGTLWLGTDGNGLVAMDTETGQLTAYKRSPSDPGTLSNNIIRSMYEDREGVLWVGTDQGLDRFDSLTRAFIHDQNSQLFDSLDDDPVYAINEGQQGNLWLGTQKGLLEWDRSAAHLQEFQHDPNIPDSLSDNSIRSVFRDSLGALWIGTRSGLDRLATSQKGFVHYYHNPNDPQSLISDSVRTLYEDRSGVMWVGTSGGGLSKYARASQKFDLYKTAPGTPNSLSDNNVWSVYGDHDGNLWIGTFSAGLNKLDRLSGAVTVYKHNPEDPNSISNDEIRAVLEGHDGVLWIGTEHGGLNRLDPKTGIFSHYQHDVRNSNSLGSDSVFALYEDRLGRLWAGAYGGGLNLFDPATDGFVHYRYDANAPFSLSDDSVKAILEDHSGTLWVGTLGGLDRFDGQTRQFTAYHNDPEDPGSISSDLIFSLAEDSEGTLWIGTLGGGLNRFDQATGSFTRYTEKNGLPDDTIYGILTGADGSLWLSTNKGISKFDPKLDTFRNYDVSDGLQGNQFNPGAYFQSRGGEMFFGGTHGLNVFFPKQVTDNPVPPPLVITAFKKFNQLSQTDLLPNEPIQLSYRDSFISFEFSALDFNAPQKNQYAYKLDGFDKDWIQAGQQRYATYTNLPGGHYVLQVKASNNDGVWNEQGVSIPIIITPPIWQSWWFIGSLLLLLSVVIAGGFRWRLNSVRAQNLLLETQISERTAELRQANELLENEIEQRAKIEKELAEKAAVEAVTADRTRLARDLHDAVTQTLFSASLTAEVLPDLWEMDVNEAKNSTEELRQLTRGALAEMRTLLMELRPATLTQTRLSDLIRQLCEAFIGRSRLPIILTIEGDCELPPEVQVACYRIAQESLNNVYKYARATQVNVNLFLSPEQVHFETCDNGIGFDMQTVKPTSMGTRIMRERAEAIGAELKITSQPGKGTSVSLTWHANPQRRLQVL